MSAPQRYRSGAYGAMVADDNGPWVRWSDVSKTESPILAFQAWADLRARTGRRMTQDEYFLAQEAFFAAHPGEGPTSSPMVSEAPAKGLR